MAFARELRDAAVNHGITPRLVSDAPEEWRLGPLTVRVDRARNAAVLRYARTPVARATCDPAAILRAAARAVDKLRRRSRDPDLLLAALERAYRRLGGARVPLARLYDALSDDTTRAQFSWDLARLQRERRLVYNGRRLDFGVATGRPTRRDVIWIEDEAGTGAWYAWFRMIPQKETDRAAAT